MSRALKETGQFKKDKKRIKGSGRYDWAKMHSVVKELINDRPLGFPPEEAERLRMASKKQITDTKQLKDQRR